MGQFKRVNKYFSTDKNKDALDNIAGVSPLYDFKLNPSHRTDDLIQDYKGIAVQYGFMTLFITACPFIPILAMLTNFVELKNDGSKFLEETR